jgi:hypothetical protein
MLALGAGRALSQSVEAFEDATQLTVEGGEVKAVTDGPAVTEGKAAASLEPGATVIIRFTWPDVAKVPWLRLDTLSGGGARGRLRVELQAGRDRWWSYAGLEAGADTLAIPLPAVMPKLEPQIVVTMRISNEGDKAISLDNLRLEAPAQAPDGAVLLDCGPTGQALWPGFSAILPNQPPLLWRNPLGIQGHSWAWPDPLTGDQVGWRLQDGVGDRFVLRTGAESTYANFWLTHMAGGRRPAVEATLKANGKTLWQHRLNQRQMLGEEGLLMGHGGSWTGEWFNRTVAPAMVDEFSLSLPAGEVSIDAHQVQIAAIAMCPVSKRREMDAYLREVRSDLERYRRQFVVGWSCQYLSDIEPTEAQKAGGLIVALPPDEQAFDTDYMPQAEHCPEKITISGANGSTVIVPVAMVPLNKTGAIQAMFRPFRNEQGRVLPLRPADTSMLFLERVARLERGRVEFDPWVVQPRLTNVAAREVVHAALVVDIPERSDGGVYSGSVALRGAGVNLEVPVEIEVRQLQTDGETSTFSCVSYMTGGDLNGQLTSLLNDSAQRSLTREVRQTVFQQGVNSTMLPGAYVAGNRNVFDGPMKDSLQAYPLSEARGVTLLHLVQPQRMMQHLNVQEGSGAYRRLMATAMVETLKLAASAKLSQFALHMDWARSLDELERLATPLSADEALANAPLSAYVHASMLKDAPPAQLARKASAYSTLVVVADTDALDKAIKPFKALEGHRRVLLYFNPMDARQGGLPMAAVGFDGVVCTNLFMHPGPYCGFGGRNRGIVVPQPRGMAITLGMLEYRQAMNDWRLVGRCRTLVEQARKANVSALALEGVLREAAQIGAAYKPMQRADATELRGRLIDAASTVQANIDSR